MRKLYDLEPAEVSLVPRGANKRKFLVFKANQGVKMDPKQQKELQELIKKADPKVMKQIDTIIKAQETEGGTAMDPRAQAALKAVARILMPFKDQITDDMLDQTLSASGFGEALEDIEGGAEDKGNPGEGTVDVDKNDDVSPEHMDEAKKAASAAYGAHLEKLGYQKYPPADMQQKSVTKDVEGDDADDDEEEGEDVSKTAVTKADGTLDLSAVPASVRPAVEAIYKGNQELVKKNAELETQIKEERDQRKSKEIVAKAESFSHLGIPKDDLVAQLKDADASGKEAFERVCKNFEALNNQAKTAKLFEEKGSSNTNLAGGDAYAKIQAAVDGIVAKSEGKVSSADAEETFLRTPEGQKMYAEYKSARPGGI